MNYTVVIPARYDSARLPGKPLADLGGKPMLQRVCERAGASSAARVVVATDDSRVAELCEALGADCRMTRGDHACGTDRVAEACQRLGLPDEAIVVNVQGDEPLIPPAVIDQVARNLAANPQAAIASLCEPVARGEDLRDPNIVKVVVGERDLALYFSRAPIPWQRGAFGAGVPDGALRTPARRHLGIYGYRVGLLRQFAQWPEHPLERLEALEQLRAMANGARIHIAEACAPVPPGVDTREDLERARRTLAMRDA